MDGAERLPVPLETVVGGKYRLDRLLGIGGYGAVYLATHLELSRTVAVKVLHIDGVSADTLSRFQREAKATGSLGHPHIVQVTDFQRGPPAFLVMEYLRGQSLAQTLRVTSRLEPMRAARITLQILSALDATHHIGIVHRDIKPANLLLVGTATDEDFVKVLDFGIAKDLSGAATMATESGAVLGTLGYMAPEQALGLSVDERADIYGVGGVLYRMLAGATPAQAENVGELMRILAHGTIVPLEQRASGLPPALCAVVTRALAHDPEARFPDAASFALDLAAALGLRTPPWAMARASAGASNALAKGGGPLATADTPTATGASMPAVSPPLSLPVSPAEAPARSGAKTAIIAMVAVVVAGLLVSVGALGAVALWHARTDAPAVADASAVSAAATVASAAKPAAATSTPPVPKPPGGAPRVASPPAEPAASARPTAAPVAVVDKKGTCKCFTSGLRHALCQGGVCVFSGPNGAPCSGVDPNSGEPATGTLKCPQ